MRPFFSFLFVLAVFTVVVVVTNQHGELQQPVLYEYLISNFREDTASRNAVAAILLNYRMYDTMFEALILLTAIIGMKQFLPAAQELKNEENGSHH